MNRRTEQSPNATAGREPSGVHRRTSVPDPETFYVRPHRRGGYCVMTEGRATPLSTHWTMRDAVMLAELLAKKANARVVVEE